MEEERSPGEKSVSPKSSTGTETKYGAGGQAERLENHFKCILSAAKQKYYFLRLYLFMREKESTRGSSERQKQAPPLSREPNGGLDLRAPGS